MGFDERPLLACHAGHAALIVALYRRDGVAVPLSLNSARKRFGILVWIQIIEPGFLIASRGQECRLGLTDVAPDFDVQAREYPPQSKRSRRPSKSSLR